MSTRVLLQRLNLINDNTHNQIRPVSLAPFSSNRDAVSPPVPTPASLCGKKAKKAGLFSLEADLQTAGLALICVVAVEVWGLGIFLQRR